MKALFLVISILIFSSVCYSVSPKLSDMFYQDDDYIYRSIPFHINLDDTQLMAKLIDAATVESLNLTRKIISDVTKKSDSSALKQIQDQIEGVLNVDKALEDLNLQIGTFANSTKSRGWDIADLLPKGLIVFGGVSGSLSVGISVSGSATVGFIIFIDKIDRIKKSELNNYIESASSDLELVQIKKIFSSVSVDFNESFRVAFGIKNSLTGIDPANSLEVQTYYNPDIAPVIIFAPAFGAGLGGGLSLRVGIAPVWWRGYKILEPEDLYGWGLAYSQDVSASAGFNFKAGFIDSDSVEGPSFFGTSIDYFLASAALTVGPQAEFSPAKINAIFIKHPEAIISGFKSQAQSIYSRQLKESSTDLWKDIVAE